MASGNTNFATLASITLQNFANEIFDNVITNNRTLSELQKAGNIKIVGGGREFLHPVYYQKNNTFAAIDKNGTIPTDLQDPLTRAKYDIKTLAGSITYNLVEDAMNAGNKEKLIDYVEALKMDAETSMTELMGDQMYTADSAVGSVNFDSIPRFISTAPSVQTTDPGNIASDDTTNTYWHNYTDATTVSAFGTSVGLLAMDNAINGSTYGRQGPTFIITTKAVYSLFNASLQANQRFTDPDRAAAGFKNLLYTTLPVMFDDNCPTGRMYFIDANALRLQVLAQGNMKMSSFQEAYSQLQARALLFILGNLTCGSRRTQGVINSITG